MRKIISVLSLSILIITPSLFSVDKNGYIPAFKLKLNDLALHRTAHPGSPLDKAGRKFALLGDESGSFEAWAYPLKLLRRFELSFYVEHSTRPLKGKDIVRYIKVTPEATTLTYTYQSFTVKAVYITPVHEPGSLILLQVDTTEPLTIMCSFIPVLQPMWPAGIGGQYSYWNKELKAYVISEPTKKNHAIVGSPAARGISYTPAHMLSDTPNEFKIEIPQPSLVRNKYIPICIAGGKGSWEDVSKVYKKLLRDPEKLYRDNYHHFQNLRYNTLQVDTPNNCLDLALEWAKVALDNLVVDHPDLGQGLVAGLGASGRSGRPGFGWFFGGDAYINSLSLNSYGAYPATKNALSFTQKWQRKDGKMAHELSQATGYIDWWEDYPYGYIHGDTTPYYIIAVYDYVKMSGDVDFVKSNWTSLMKAFEWCLSTDENRDNLMDNQKAGLGALEYGELTGIETDIYLAALWTRAAYCMEKLAQTVGKEAYIQKANHHFKKAKQAFNHKFWDEQNEFYAYAFNAQGQKVKEISPWNAVGMMWKLGTPERSRKSLERINTSELTTDWGIRSISNKSSYFGPLNYNYGAVWPFLSGWVSTALFKHHLSVQGYTLLLSTAQHIFHRTLGSISEVFSGTHHIWPQESVPHQGFSSAGVVFPLVRGLCGIEGNSLEKTLTFSPHFPADWNKVIIQNLKVGKSSFSLDYKREKDKIIISVNATHASGYTLHLAPALGAGNQIRFMTVNGKKLNFKKETYPQVVQAVSSIPLQNGTTQIQVDFEPGVEILPYKPKSKIGERNKGLKVISFKKEKEKLIIEVEGRAGKTYYLRVMNEGLIKKVEGASLKGKKVKIYFPANQEHKFLSQRILFYLKSDY